MSTPKLFRFYLLNNQGKYYYQDSSGAILLSDTERYLQDSPSNWDKINIQFGRNERYWGIFRKSGVSIDFRGDGANILRAIYYSNNGANYDAYCRFVIKKRNDGSTQVWQYMDYTAFDIDFCEELVDGADKDGTIFSCRLLQGGLQQMIEDKMNTPYEIEVDSDFVNVVMDGIKLQSKDNFTIWAWAFEDRLSTTAFFFPVAFVNSESVFPVGDGYQSMPDSGITDRDYNAFYKVSKDVEASFNFNIQVEITANAANTSDLIFKLQLDIFRSGNLITPVNTATHNVYTSAPFTPGQNATLNINVSYPYSLLKGDVVTLNFVGEPDPNAGGQLYDVVVHGGDINIIGVRQTPTSIVKAIRYDKAVNKLIQRITGGSYAFTSGWLAYKPPLANLADNGLFNNAPGYTYLISGDGVRGFASPKLVLKLADVLQDCWARWMVGATTINEIFRMERINVFLSRSSVAFTIPQISGSVKRKTATQFLFNQVKVGYADQDLDKINGRYEINSEQVYKMPNTRPQLEVDWVSPFRADVYGIEYVRTEDNTAEETARQADTNVFLLEAYEPSPGADLNLIRYSGADFINNVFDSDTLYNIGLSPKRNMYRHLPYFRSVLNILDGQTDSSALIEFQTGKKNVRASSYIDGKIVTEDTGIFPGGATVDGSIPDKLFIPLIYEFAAQPPENLISLIEQDPFAMIQFYDNGVLRGGWVLDIGVTPATKEIYDITLLASPDYEL